MMEGLKFSGQTGNFVSLNAHHTLSAIKQHMREVFLPMLGHSKNQRTFRLVYQGKWRWRGSQACALPASYSGPFSDPRVA